MLFFIDTTELLLSFTKLGFKNIKKQNNNMKHSKSIIIFLFLLSPILGIAQVMPVSFFQKKQSTTGPGDGLTSATAGTSALQIKTDYPASTDGVYFINLPTVGIKQTYCLMNSALDGGGWMLALKATRGTTFSYSANYWTTTNTLNPTALNTIDGDAKFDVMNTFAAKDMMALWPDIPNVNTESGSIDNLTQWSWLQNNFHSGGARITLLSKLNGTRTAYFTSTNGTMSFNGYGTQFSNQGGFTFYGTNYAVNANARVRWGFAWNNEADQLTNDVSGGIGMDYQNFSAGDRVGCCQINTGINRSARVEVYIR
jgi:hypothetical protein